MEGTVQRVRPKLMTVCTMLVGLVPLLWAQGSGADVIKRIAAPMVGGLFTSAFLTLELIPVIYTYWRSEQLLWQEFAERAKERFVWLEASAKLVWTGLGVSAFALVFALYLPDAAPHCLTVAGCSLAVAAGSFVAYLRVRRLGKRTMRELAEGSVLG
jgi:Cu(I)/Ag(I) efflux system membrane protein CusA/SilA